MLKEDEILDDKLSVEAFTELRYIYTKASAESRIGLLLLSLCFLFRKIQNVHRDNENVRDLYSKKECISIL